MRIILILLLAFFSLGSIASDAPIKNIKFIGNIDKSIPIFIGDCGQPNAYSIAKPAIMICNELKSYITLDSLRFIMYHELGHIYHKDFAKRDFLIAKYATDESYIAMRMRQHEWEADYYAINRLIDEGYDNKACGYLELFYGSKRHNTMNKLSTHPSIDTRYLVCMDSLTNNKKVDFITREEI
jgi:hypothetical protein